jgi:Xaa-Pro aminopeptidase
MLDALPGEKKVYLPWQQLHSHLSDILAGSHRIAMQYSPLNAIPRISRVNAETVELVRSFGVDVVSSADLVQTFEAVWTAEQVETHLYAAGHMRKIVDVTFGEVARRIRDKIPTTELDIQEFIWNQHEVRNMTSSHRPIVAINSHSADPHYLPDREHNRTMNEGDFLLIDVCAKKRVAHDVYDEITWTGYIGRSVPDLNIDNLENQDNRRLMRGTCFSIEPGEYLKGQFGVRSEVDVYLDESEAAVTGQPIQTHGTPILSL